MVRGVQVEVVDRLSGPIVAVGNDYRDGHVIAPHSHRRGQLIFGASGAVILATPEGTCVMPPQRGMWIPAGVIHDVRMLGAVRMQSLYVEPDAADGMPDRCQVVGISPFMRSLIAEAMDLPLTCAAGSRAGALMALIHHEIRELPVLPLSLPCPSAGPLAKPCRAFLAKPDAHQRIEAWSEAIGMSRRAFTRLFRRETGMSFVEWRQQACLVAALPRLVAGEPVTAVAIDLGYDYPAAFTTMFKRVLGAPPRAYLRQAA
jgi:AraC-like DNA-binding protein